MSKTKRKDTMGSNPYSPQQPWKPGVSHLPRATTKWDEPSAIEMTQGMKARPTPAIDSEGNSLVSLHKFLRLSNHSHQQTADHSDIFQGSQVQRLHS